ncbi:MAG TPA: hypothetical protein VHK05_01385 [Candidatus Limnocylindrales bacterium]|nr:hypothetical protein [Candidatus Limnocylindrales bacterium]
MQIIEVDAGPAGGGTPVGDAGLRRRSVECEVVGRGHEVQGRAHDRRLDDRSLVKRGLQVVDRVAGAARPQRDVGRVGMLCLEPGEPADDLRDRPTMAVEQALAGQGRPVQCTD